MFKRHQIAAPERSGRLLLGSPAALGGTALGMARRHRRTRQEGRLVRHLLTGCPVCTAPARSLGVMGLLPQAAPDYEEALRRLEMMAVLAESEAAVERSRGEAQWALLEKHPHERRLLMVKSDARFQHWGLFSKVLARARSVGRKDPVAAVDVAELALAVAELLSPEHYGAERIQDFRAAALGALGDTSGQQVLGQQAFLRVHRSVGVLSLAGDPLSVTMWARYGDNHRGLCVRFATEGNDYFGRAQRVRYRQDYPAFSGLKTPMDQQYDNILLTKSSEWRSQREWRLITDKGAGNHDFPRQMLVAVIFGLRMADEQKEEVRGWLRDAPWVQFLQAEMVPRTFKLRLCDAAPWQS